jgi:hypothetical protein
MNFMRNYLVSLGEIGLYRSTALELFPIAAQAQRATHAIQT